ncbi:hypothetical protein NDU88_003612 [Pleurodeles waltl]|uniref:Uncharacterized protein n=1 Tax=Pleurodeles waltl TaxID=8319 RepID=A0AAV7PAE5_PLEWA|nr:hypothetical protein NDU88_003612 [Pleurodeles waltl]
MMRASCRNHRLQPPYAPRKPHPRLGCFRGGPLRGGDAVAAAGLLCAHRRLMQACSADRQTAAGTPAAATGRILILPLVLGESTPVASGKFQRGPTTAATALRSD